MAVLDTGACRSACARLPGLGAARPRPAPRPRAAVLDGASYVWAPTSIPRVLSPSPEMTPTSRSWMCVLNVRARRRVARRPHPDSGVGVVARKPHGRRDPRGHQVQEAAVHRWDVQSALGDADPLQMPIADDGVDEFVGIARQLRGPAPITLITTDSNREDRRLRRGAGRVGGGDRVGARPAPVRANPGDALRVEGDRRVLDAFLDADRIARSERRSDSGQAWESRDAGISRICVSFLNGWTITQVRVPQALLKPIGVPTPGFRGSGPLKSLGGRTTVRGPRRAADTERCPVHRTTLIDPKPETRRLECRNYVDLARRMSIPTDDAFRQFVETWVTSLLRLPTPRPQRTLVSGLCAHQTTSLSPTPHGVATATSSPSRSSPDAPGRCPRTHLTCAVRGVWSRSRSAAHRPRRQIPCMRMPSGSNSAETASS